ncbi:glycosyltransferase family 1 protein [Halobacillus rhizosphaerae]|uniref:glycosyltransferase family 4 protein n=1 Tax=Halobacillus rhizosphaerae TaxID=3064889 RepID=UPI00398B3F71
MKIFINGRFLTQKITGVQRYALEVVKALDQHLSIDPDSSSYNIILLVPSHHQRTNLNLKNIKIEKVGILKGHLWEQIELFQKTKNQLLLNLCNSGPLFKKKQVTVIHDMAVFANPKNFSLLFKNWYKILFLAQGYFSKSIVTVSNFSKAELIKYLRIDKFKIKVIYEGKEHFSKLPEGIENLNLENIKPYILAVSSINPNKNFAAIIEAVKYINKDIRILIAGGTNPKIFKGEKNEVPENVKYLGYVSDKDLKSLYQNAYCFIYPSLYEGFGLPPLEAMSVGCPVIVSDSSSLPEVGGKAVLYCDPLKPRSISDKIEKLLDDKGLREKLAELGYKQAGKFSWEFTAKELFDHIIKL